jgi:hypothetical protein
VFWALNPTLGLIVRWKEVEQQGPHCDCKNRVDRDNIWSQGDSMNCAWKYLAAIMGSGHLCLSAIGFHRATAGTFFNRHTRIGSHTRHRRCHKGQQKQ